MRTDDRQHDVTEIKIMDEENQQSTEIIDDSNEKNEDTLVQAEEATSNKKIIQAEQNSLEQLQRLKAEFANFKKRTENDRIMLADIIKSEFIIKLLPAIDDFDRLLEHTNVTNQELVTGITLIYQKLKDTLKEQGLKPVHSLGKKFDPNFHEALLVEHNENSEENLIIEEWRKGYIFKERLLRPAQVKVNKIEN